MNEIAERALELLPTHRRWKKGGWEYRGRMCLGTALMNAAGIDLAGLGVMNVVDGNDVGYSCLAKVPALVLAKVRQIIVEQFPDRMAYMAHDLTSPEYVVTAFNDDEATTFADVRLVLEKLAAG